MEMPIDYEILKIIGYFLVYPLMAIFTTTRIAKWHFEKDIKKQYLSAKDVVANDLIIAISSMLTAMWRLGNTKKQIEAGWLRKDDQNVIENIQNLLFEVQNNTMNSYIHLGKAGLYFGTDIMEKVSQFQSELNSMIAEDNFEVFCKENWDDYRRENIVPVIQEIHDELKATVLSDRIKSFRLYMP